MDFFKVAHRHDPRRNVSMYPDKKIDKAAPVQQSVMVHWMTARTTDLAISSVRLPAQLHRVGRTGQSGRPVCLLKASSGPLVNNPCRHRRLV